MSKKDKIISKIDITPSSNLVEVFASNYTVKTAIADIIDNCITARAMHIDVNFVFNGMESYISILDDGYGMNKDVLEGALIYGNVSTTEARDVNDTGRFSVGMKSAASSIANKLIVISKGTNGITNSYVIDFKNMGITKKWTAYQIENRPEFEIKTKTGTNIILENLKLENDERTNSVILSNEDSFLKNVENVERHLSYTYNRFFDIGVIITINGKVVKGWSPFSIGSPSDVATVNAVYDETIKVGNSKARIVGYVLPPLDYLDPDQKAYVKGNANSLITLQGFYFYRSNRLINLGGWFDIEGIESDMKYNYARIGIFVDNSLDNYLGINFVKNTINPPQEFMESLAAVARKVRNASVKNFNSKNNPRPYSKKNRESINPWIVQHTQNGIKVKINKDHPTIKMVTETLDEKKKTMLFNLLEKSIPIGEFQSFTGVDDDYSQEEILTMVSELYEKLYRSNMNDIEIGKEIVKTAPFNDEKYSSIVFDYLLKRREEHEK